MNKKVLIYVQHLLGAGHLVRAMSLAEVLAATSHTVLLVSGGFPIERVVAGYDYLQLPPCQAVEGDFTRLVDSTNHSIDDLWRARRAAQLLAAVMSFQPDLVITETFPFGRGQFRFELEPLLAWIRQQPAVLLMASIRDILQRRGDSKNRKAVALIKQHYDCVLVHADERLFKLNSSFDLADQISEKVRYTGYIYQPQTSLGFTNDSDGFDEIVVSGGSGTVSARLLATAQQARSMSAANKRVWRLLSGRSVCRYKIESTPGLIIEANRKDFIVLLRRCALSVSQAGYNTTLDVLTSGARSLLIPFVGNGETEQRDRAAALERAGRVSQLAEAELTPRTLAHAVDLALERKPRLLQVKQDGAAASARIIEQYLG